MAKQSYFFLFLSLVSLCSSTTTLHDATIPATVFPTNPTTTPPATFPPVTITPTNPVTTIPPPTLTPPVTNPVTQYPPAQPSGTVPVPVPVPVVAPPVVSVPVPVVAPPVVSNSPSVPGQSWCVAKPGASQISLQQALDYACGIGGADCSLIQQGGSCYSPISLQSHASVAFNSYYQKNPSPQSCDFGGAASVVSTNPSTGSCVYQTGSSGGTTTPTPSTQTVNQPPVTQTPMTPTGGGIIGVGTPPAVFNPANPSPNSNTLTDPSPGGAAVYGFDGSPNGSNPTSSDSTHLHIHSGHNMAATLILYVVLFH